jgi:hypothetical protein
MSEPERLLHPMNIILKRKKNKTAEKTEPYKPDRKMMLLVLDENDK